MVRKFINWLRPAVQDHDGTASYRRLTALFFVSIDGYVIVTDKIVDQFMLNAHYSVLAFILLLTGIITTQNVLQFLNRKSDEK